ncbi:MAG: tyrosine-type recombinase/integrase [Burkholderiaceae bacterium]
MAALTDSKVKAAKRMAKAYRLADARGLFLLVTPSGGKHWKLKYRLGGKEQRFAVGSYPEVGLAAARDRVTAARLLIADGLHPLAAQKRDQAKKLDQSLTTFGAVATAWIDANKEGWKPYYLSQVKRFLGRYVIETTLADKPIREVTTKDIRQVLQSIAVRTKLAEGERKAGGSASIAINVRTWCRGIFVYALEREYVDADPTYALRNLTELKRSAASVKHGKALDPKQIRELLAALVHFRGARATSIALELLLLTFVRTGELRQARWEEIDLEACQWRIPASRMKAGKPHMVPLSKPAISLLKELQGITGTTGSLFPNSRRPAACMSATTINRALERLGFNGKGSIGFAAHGFRATASTRLHEAGFAGNVIELQLAHMERNKVKAAYNHFDYVPERTAMMEKWGEYLDTLRPGANIVVMNAMVA